MLKETTMQNPENIDASLFTYLGEYNFGCYKELKHLRNSIKSTSFSSVTDHEVNVVLGEYKGSSFRFSPNVHMLPLILISIPSCGFTDSTSYTEVCKKIIGADTEYGGQSYKIGLCPQEAAPVMLLEHYNGNNDLRYIWRNGEWVSIMSEPIYYSRQNLIPFETYRCRSLLQVCKVGSESLNPGRFIHLREDLGFIDYSHNAPPDSLIFHSRDRLVFALYKKV